MTDHLCPDCRDDPDMASKPARPVATDRKTGKVVPAKRCATHHRAITQARKGRVREQRLQKVYGLSRDDYNGLLEWQGGKCYVCRIANGKTKALAVDHSHVSSEVRCIACGRCNFDLLGKYDVEMLLRAVEVLREDPPPARRFFGGPRYVPTEET